MPATLPVYRLHSDDATSQRLMNYAQGIFGTNGDFQLARRGTSHVLRKDQCVVEIAEASGGVWAADESQLWKHALVPKLPSTEAALYRCQPIRVRRRGMRRCGRHAKGRRMFVHATAGQVHGSRIAALTPAPLTATDVCTSVFTSSEAFDSGLRFVYLLVAGQACTALLLCATAALELQ